MFILQVIEACNSNRWSSKTRFRRLEAYRISISADIRYCDQTVTNAQGIIEQLHKKADDEVLRLGLGLGASAAVTLGNIIMKFSLFLRIRVLIECVTQIVQISKLYPGGIFQNFWFLFTAHLLKAFPIFRPKHAIFTTSC